MRSEIIVTLLAVSLTSYPGCRSRTQSASDVQFNLTENPNFKALPKDAQERYLQVSKQFQQRFMGQGFEIYREAYGNTIRMTFDEYYGSDLTSFDDEKVRYYLVSPHDENGNRVAFTHKSEFTEDGLTIYLSAFNWTNRKQALARAPFSFRMNDDPKQVAGALREQLKSYAAQIGSKVKSLQDMIGWASIAYFGVVFSVVVYYMIVTPGKKKLSVLPGSLAIAVTVVYMVFTWATARESIEVKP